MGVGEWVNEWGGYGCAGWFGYGLESYIFLHQPPHSPTHILKAYFDVNMLVKILIFRIITKLRRACLLRSTQHFRKGNRLIWGRGKGGGQL